MRYAAPADALPVGRLNAMARRLSRMLAHLTIISWPAPPVKPAEFDEFHDAVIEDCNTHLFIAYSLRSAA